MISISECACAVARPSTSISYSNDQTSTLEIKYHLARVQLSLEFEVFEFEYLDYDNNMVQLYFASTLWVTATTVVIKKVKPTETQSCGQNWQMRKPLLST